MEKVNLKSNKHTTGATVDIVVVVLSSRYIEGMLSVETGSGELCILQ